MQELDFLDDDELYYSDGIQYFLFYAHTQVYAIEAQFINEIIEYQSYTKVPNLSECILGVTNVRGNIVGVVDFLMRCKIQITEITSKSSFVIINHTNQNIALLVDEIYEVDGFSDEMKHEAPEFGTNIEPRFIQNIVTYKDKNVFLLNLDELFNMNELSLEVYDGWVLWWRGDRSFKTSKY